MMKYILLTAFITGGLIAAEDLSFAYEGNAQARERLSGIQGKKAPELQVKDWVNSGELKLEDLKGKIVVLDFWATWCAPCRREIPMLNALARENRDHGVEVIGIGFPQHKFGANWFTCGCCVTCDGTACCLC